MQDGGNKTSFALSPDTMADIGALMGQVNNVAGADSRVIGSATKIQGLLQAGAAQMAEKEADPERQRALREIAAGNFGNGNLDTAIVDGQPAGRDDPGSAAGGGDLDAAVLDGQPAGRRDAGTLEEARRRAVEAHQQGEVVPGAMTADDFGKDDVADGKKPKIIYEQLPPDPAAGQELVGRGGAPAPDNQGIFERNVQPVHGDNNIGNDPQEQKNWLIRLIDKILNALKKCWKNFKKFCSKNDVPQADQDRLNRGFGGAIAVAEAAGQDARNAPVVDGDGKGQNDHADQVEKRREQQQNTDKGR